MSPEQVKDFTHHSHEFGSYYKNMIEHIRRNAVELHRFYNSPMSVHTIDGISLVFLGKGAERTVYLKDDIVYKIARISADSDANLAEYEFYYKIMSKRVRNMFIKPLRYEKLSDRHSLLLTEYAGDTLENKIINHMFRKYKYNKTFFIRQTNETISRSGQVVKLQLWLEARIEGALFAMGVDISDLHAANISETGKILDFAGIPSQRPFIN